MFNRKGRSSFITIRRLKAVRCIRMYCGILFSDNKGFCSILLGFYIIKYHAFLNH